MRVRSNGARLLVAVLAIFVLGLANASAQVLFTTQEDFAPAGTASGTNISVGPPGTIGDSDGSTTNGLGNNVNPGGTDTAGALPLAQNVNGYQQANLGDKAANAGFLAALKNNTMLSLDYTLLQDVVKGDGGYLEIWVVFNWSGGYQQINNNAFFTAANLLAGTHTVTYNYSALQDGLPTSQPGYFQQFIVLNSGGALTPADHIQVYIDNIRVSSVPEPASLALLGLGALGLMGLAIRRRLS